MTRYISKAYDEIFRDINIGVNGFLSYELLITGH